MAFNAKLVRVLTTKSYEMLKTPLYDVEESNQIEQELKGYLDALNQNKLDWAESVTTVSSNPVSPHYTRHT
jgi:hypothetical protein